VRMETLRRATIYASKSPGVADALLNALQRRAALPEATDAALALFDFGYLVETYREGTYALAMATPAIETIDGYQLVLKAKALQHDDATMQQAASLIADGLPTRTVVR